MCRAMKLLTTSIALHDLDLTGMAIPSKRRIRPLMQDLRRPCIFCFKTLETPVRHSQSKRFFRRVNDEQDLGNHAVH